MRSLKHRAETYIGSGRTRRPKGRFFSSRASLFDKAVALFGSEVPHPSKEQTHNEMHGRFPIVSQVPDPRQPGHFLFCVTLKLREGWLGSDPVYCFDERGNPVSRARI